MESILFFSKFFSVVSTLVFPALVMLFGWLYARGSLSWRSFLGYSDRQAGFYESRGLWGESMKEQQGAGIWPNAKYGRTPEQRDAYSRAGGRMFFRCGLAGLLFSLAFAWMGEWLFRLNRLLVFFVCTLAMGILLVVGGVLLCRHMRRLADGRKRKE